MPIDSETKRRSAQSDRWCLVLPRADGTIDEGDRAHVQGLYSGIDYFAGTAVTGPPVGGLMMMGAGR